MALKDYYELSAMLRVQLPILLSFAVLKCLMGWVVNFWASALVPRRLKPMIEPVRKAFTNTLSVVYATLIAAAASFTLTSSDGWFNKRNPSEKMATLLVCTEFDLVRVQGLACTVGLLALFTSSDPFTLGLALCIFKTVADGSVFGLFVCLCTYAAAMGVHKTNSKKFFGVMFVINSLYSATCYTEDNMNNRTGGAVLATCFGGLVLVYGTTVWFYRSLWTVAKKGTQVVSGRLVSGTQRVKFMVQRPVTDEEKDGVDGQEYHETAETEEELHPHAD